MKLSEMSADKAFDTIVELTPHIANILENKEVKKLLKKVEVTGKDKEKATDKAYEETLKKIKPFILILFKDSKEDIFSMVGIVNDLNVEEVRQMNFLKINELILELIMDKDLIELFTSRMGSVLNA